MLNIIVLTVLGLIRSVVLGGFLCYTWNIHSHPYGGTDITFAQGMVFGLVLQVVGGVLRGPGNPEKEKTNDEMIAWLILVSFSSSIAIALTWALVALLSN